MRFKVARYERLKESVNALKEILASEDFDVDKELNRLNIFSSSSVHIAGSGSEGAKNAFISSILEEVLRNKSLVAKHATKCLQRANESLEDLKREIVKDLELLP